MEEIKKKSSKKVRIIILVSAACALAIGAAFVYLSWSSPRNAFSAQTASPQAQIKVPDQVAVVDDNQQQAQQKVVTQSAPSPTGEFENQNVIHILLMGIDSSQKTMELNMGWRSDMLMLCTLNLDKSTIALTTIPRDTRTYAYHLDDNGNATSTQLTKINSAYQYGYGPKFGAQNEMLAVHDFLTNASGVNVPVSYYVSVDLDNAPKLADELGGIPITLDVNFPGLGKKGETVTINSENCDKFLQNRYDIGGDIARARHHEEFLFSMIKEIKNKGAVHSAVALFNLYTQYVKTNLNLQQIIALAGVLDNFDLDDLDYKVIDGEYKYINGLCYYIADTNDVKSRIGYLVKQ